MPDYPTSVIFVWQVFIVDTRASKKQIKDSVHRLYDIQTKKVNTLIRYGAFLPQSLGSHNMGTAKWWGWGLYTSRGGKMQEGVRDRQ